MKCVICHGEDIQPKDVREELALGNDVVFVPVRVLTCTTCGERYYDRRTLQYLEETERKLRAGSSDLHQTGRVLMIR